MGMRARSVCAARCPGSESVEGVGDFLGVPHSIAVETGELVQYSDFDQGCTVRPTLPTAIPNSAAAVSESMTGSRNSTSSSRRDERSCPHLFR